MIILPTLKGVISKYKTLKNKFLVGGDFTSLSDSDTYGSTRLNTDGSRDTTFYSRFNSSINAIVIQPSDGKIIYGGAFTRYDEVAINRIAKLNTDGSLDSSFSTGTGFNGAVNSIALQSDGKIICGGAFTSYNGTTVNRIVRLNADGTLDSSFTIGTGFSAAVSTITIQPDGKIICGGSFITYNGTSSAYIARLNTDGTIDSSFTIGTGFNAVVNAIVIQSDNNNKIICGGNFTSYNGNTTTRIVRLNADGSWDSSVFPAAAAFNGAINAIVIDSSALICVGAFTTYNTLDANRIILFNVSGDNISLMQRPAGFNGTVNCMTVVKHDIGADVKIFFGGAFTTYDSITVNRIACLIYSPSYNGIIGLDTSFSMGTGFENTVSVIAIQSDNKIICGGLFPTYKATSANRIYRLNENTEIDNTFAVGTGFGATVNAIAVQSDNKIICTGTFTSYNGTTVNRIVRLNTDGTIDSSFTIGTGFNNIVNAIVVQYDGKIICGGAFTAYNGTTINRIARLNTDGTLDTSFVVGTGFNGAVNSIAILSYDANLNLGKIIYTGAFTSYNGTAINRIACLSLDGPIDSSFTTNVGTGFNNTVNTVAIQSDSKILCGGTFTTYKGVTSNRIIRLNSDGTLDSGFSTGTGFALTISIIKIQSDGKVIVGGSFTSYNGTSSVRIVRLNTDGAMDSDFITGTGFNNNVLTIFIQSDGKIICSGDFTSYKDSTAHYLCRLTSNGSRDNTFKTKTSARVFGIIQLN